MSTLLDLQVECDIVSLWLEMTDELQGWKTESGDLEHLLIGDVEYESVIWRNGIEPLSGQEIIQCFDSAGEYATTLKEAYNIVADRPTACKLGALDFINDTRFTLPVLDMRESFAQAGRPVYSYTFDQANPWQQSSRAHHAVDLVMLFGDLDLTHNPGAASVREQFRTKWIKFCNGQEPWSSGDTYAFGPYGECGLLSEDGYSGRRRLQACSLLKEVGPSNYNAVFARLATGRISLLN